MIYKGIKMKFKVVLVSIIVVFILGACSKQAHEENAEDVNKVEQNTMAQSSHKAVVEEIAEAKSYTYLRVKEGDKDYWIAITKRPMEKGETIYFNKALEMKNFKSTDLNKTFESVLFVQDISKQPVQDQPQMGSSSAQGNKPVIVKEEVNVEPVKGGITISKLFANKKSYENKTVKIRGKVTKYNPGIMDKNWAHIQDGTSDGDNFDLTVTTQKDVKVGDVVTFEGKVALNKDFGYGYSYDVILEDAK